MIHSFRDKWLQNFYLENKYNKKIVAKIKNRLFRKLQLIDDATCDIDLRSPPSNYIEELKGNLPASTLFVSTNNGDWCLGGLMSMERLKTSI